MSEDNRCGSCGYYLKNILKFLLSHIGLVSMVIGYTVIGAFIFVKLEADHEKEVKKNITIERDEITNRLWNITDKGLYFKEDIFAEEAGKILKDFEDILIEAMDVKGWNGSMDVEKNQWTIAGALFYSIILITTIGYGHIAPKTTEGKVVTILYAIPGVPLMMLCLANIGDGMAHSFRFLYWKVCCYACTKRPRRKNRAKSTTRSYPDRRGRMYDDPRDDERSYSGRERSREDDKRSNRTMDPSPSGNPPRDSNHLELPPNGGNERDDVLYNKYALDKEHLDPENDLPYRSNRGRSSPEDSPVRDCKRDRGRSRERDLSRNREESRERERGISRDRYMDSERSRDRDRSKNRERHRTRSDHREFRDNDMPSGRIQRNPGGSIRRPPRHAYTDQPPPSVRVSQRDSGYYSRHSHTNDPRSRYAKYDVEDDYDEKYIDDIDYYEEDEEEELDENANRPVPIWLGVMLVVGYIFGGAFLFQKWESKWSFLDAVYFCFITLTTIGFGDFVPGQNDDVVDQKKIAFCSVYLLFGIALLAMSFNLIQEEVISNVKRVAKRLGIIKEKEEHVAMQY